MTKYELLQKYPSAFNFITYFSGIDGDPKEESEILKMHVNNIKRTKNNDLMGSTMSEMNQLLNVFNDEHELQEVLTYFGLNIAPEDLQTSVKPFSYRSWIKHLV